jgi:DNA repair exonuclease SbcCD ATPase subunit
MGMHLDKYRRTVDKLVNEYSAAVKSIEVEKTELKKATRSLSNHEEALRVAQEVAQSIQNQAHARIASIVSKCLSVVFDDPYEFKILFEKKRGKTEARIVFLRNGNERTPLRASGGGVNDVAAFALRLACVVLSQPSKRRLIVLDEPFRHLKPAETYGPRVASMLDQLAQEMDIQFIIVQNLPEFQTGDVVEIKS